MSITKTHGKLAADLMRRGRDTQALKGPSRNRLEEHGRHGLTAIRKLSLKSDILAL